MRECLWVACVSFIFFGMRAVTGLGACCLFPQHMLAVIPLIEDVQVSDLHRLQEGGGSSWCPIPGPSAAAAAAACVCLWSLRWEQRLTPAPGVCVGGALLPEIVQRKKLLLQSPLFSFPPPRPNNSPGSFPYSLSCGDHTLIPSGCPHTTHPSTLLGLTSEARASAPSPCSPQCKCLRLESVLPSVQKDFHI